ncbi:MOSC domain-containing protein [Kribbella pittospori]|uniref:MOSC domain-containing protein n=1 Tax=Kribbella pittospori TaxID=722689 RepID=UPI00192D2450|nr:MOSC domain-containing protein [Kribbella pittospori]
MSIPVEIVALVVSREHAFEGRPHDGPRPDPEPVSRSEVEVRAGLGIVGDRYFGQKVHRNAAVTFVDAASLDELARTLALPEPPDPHLMRRNIVLRGFPIDTLASRPGGAGRRFSLDSGSGAVEFQAYRPARPCAWMDVVLAPGAMKALRGHGGVRTTPLSDGTLRLGAATLTLLD